MDDSGIPRFDPVPLRSRRGWTPERQWRFIAALHAGLKPGRAAERAGMTRQSAYWLRTRPGAEGFAAAWDGALLAASARRRSLLEPSEYARAVEGVLHPVRYRGRIVGWDRRFDDRAFRRLLGRVDRLLEKRGMAMGKFFSPGMPELCQNPRPRPAPADPRKSGL